MNFSIAPTIRRRLAPQHELSCSWWLWRRLCSALRKRGRARSRESGAFLLGRLEPDGRRRITDYVLYDDLDPECLNSGIVRFDGRHFGALWAYCKSHGLAVVADVHVHPGSANQSDSDRAHPMISQRGHIALILPGFAAPPLHRAQVGIYRYQGAKRWTVIGPSLRADFFYIGI
jgi:proteasome lid subunit RPN8/RPN11